ncbi:hypothetical protein CRG98_021514 [Punica granatum]|uniref:Uncharacterized protein n=1 Tax=Punica granatum TaxID=22663 RepID=A0A2I0JP59_PUNGR|nr:hypothetical protein CRG98_021514 [Punica granatum]
MRGIPMIAGHPTAMGPPEFQRAAHKNRPGMSSSMNCFQSKTLRSAGLNTWSKRTIRERSLVMYENGWDEQNGLMCARSHIYRRCGDPLILPCQLACIGLYMRAVYSSTVGVSSVPWKLNTAYWGSQKAMAVLRKAQSMGHSTSEADEGAVD